MQEKPPDSSPPASERSPHILSASATMVGVCITVVSIVSVLHEEGSLVARVVAVASLAFLVSSFTAYFSIRSRRQAQRFETIAERFFLGGLVLTTFALFIIALEIKI